jgi:predicted RND superfamily exporter protein
MEKLYKYPVVIAIFIAAVTVLFATQLPKIRLDNNNIRFLPEGNHARIISEYLDEEFGGQVVILVGLDRPYGTIFDPVFLAKVRDFADAVEVIEFVKTVNSIMSTQYITGDSDSIVVTDLVPEDFSGTPKEIAELKRRIASWDLFQGAIVSNDLQATQVLVTLDVTTEEQASPEVNAALFKIRDTARQMFTGLAEVYVTGQPVINATLNEAMITDNMVLIPLVLIVVLAVLFFSFRRFTFVMLPLITVIIAVVWTAGAMAMLGIQFSILTTLLPVILVAVGSAYGIHVVTHYMEDCRGRTLSVDAHRLLVLELMRKLIKPVFLAALTTFAGFISFCFTSIVPMREFGVFASTGVIASFAVAVTLIPALLLIRGPKTIKTAAHADPGQTDRFSNAIAGIFLAIARKKALVLVTAALVIGFSAYGLSKIIVDNVLLEFFQNETDISRSDRFIRDHFGGSKDLTLVVAADSAEELLDPAVLSAVDNLSTYLAERVPEVGKVVGFTDIIKRINQVFNVDESPEGLAAREEADTGGISGDSFGFGDDFGFGFTDTSGEETTETAYTPAPKTLEYSTSDLLVLFDTAAGNYANMSGNNLVRELKRLANYDGFSYYEIPADPARYGKNTPEDLQRLVSNYLVLLAGDESSGYSNDPLEPTAIKTMIQLRTTGNRDTLAVIDRINAYIDANFPKNVRVMIGGGATLEGAITDLIVNSQVISIAVSVLIVFLIIALSYKSFIAGIIGAVPITIAILCNFAVMAFLGIKLNIGTALIASLAVGIGIDYTIHCIESFKREYLAGGKDGGDNFLRLTFISCGKAIIINAVSVGAGFGVLAFSQFKIIAEMGTLVALSMFITALISLTVIPALLTTIKPKFIYGGKK